MGLNDAKLGNFTQWRAHGAKVIRAIEWSCEKAKNAA